METRTERVPYLAFRRTALEPDKDMNVSVLTLTSSLSSAGTRSDTRRHKSGIKVVVVVVGAREACYVRELFNDVSVVGRRKPGI